MKKTQVVVGALVVLGAVCTSVAWYTGKQLPEVLDGALGQANRQLASALGSSDAGKLELLSLESGVFSSTARYRLTVVGDEGEPYALDFVDNLEHGPFPWSRIKRLELAPVMAASNYALEKTDGSSAWFEASKDQIPLKGRVSVGYDQSVRSHVEIAPLEVQDEDGSALSFSGATLQIDSTVAGDALRLGGTMGRLAVNLGNASPLGLEINGFDLLADLTMSTYGYYTGSVSVDVVGASMAFGPEQSVKLGKLQQRDLYRIEEGSLSLHQAYQVSDISFAGKPLGDLKLAWGMQRLDPAAVGSLVKWYEQHLTELETLALSQSPILGAQLMQDPVVNAAMLRILAGKPRVALEELSLRTASGESRLDMSVDLVGADLADVPLEQAFAQSVKALSTNLKISKPMIGEFAALKATLDGLDAESVRQASMTGELAGMIALQSQMATVKGDDILMNLRYGDGQVEFNGQQMTVDQFEAFVQGRAGMLSGMAQ